MDDQYQSYVNRVVRVTLPDTYQSQLQHIQSSPKFQPTIAGGERHAVPFPGYTVITPPWTEAENHEFYTHLASFQTQLLQQVDPGLIVPVPPDSFHVTVADLIWADAYRHALETPDFEEQLRGRIAEIFQQYQASIKQRQAIRWQPLGIVVMTRAIALALAPKDEYSYDQIVGFRRAVYQDLGLMGLGIEQQYYFTAHVTLGYFGEVPANLDKDPTISTPFVNQLTKTFTDLNLTWLEDAPQEFQVNRAELRKFDDMTHYYRQDDWPVLEF
ncbi:MAG: DUF1868 domain-containing protein [Leptolyngbyaceae bacterium]|nr:DUF1868 domain-containing protein [Leptolyngbyaceae bacterium]